MSPDGVTKNQIDHVTIARRFRTSLVDVRAYRSADVGSDHELVVAKIKLKLCRQVHGREKKPEYEICKLKDQKIAQEFCLELRNRFHLLADLEGVKESWQEFRKGVDDTVRGLTVLLLGLARNQRK